MTNNVPFLTGGIFFSLLLTARKTRQKARNKLNGGSDNLRDTDLMYELNYVLTGDKGTFNSTTIKRATSNYKKCTASRSMYIELDNPENKKYFSSNKNSPEILIRISRLIERFLGNDKKTWLTKALLETIYLDKKIDDDYLFDIDYNLSVSKTKFTTIQKVCLPIFLFSILRFIIENRTNNHLGEQTFYEWHTQHGGRGNWILNNNCLGDAYSNIVEVFTLSENQIKQLFQPNLNHTTPNEEINDSIKNTVPTSNHSSNITNNFFRHLMVEQ